MQHVGAYAGFRIEEREPGIAWIELDEPERLNGLTGDLKRDLVEVLTQIQLDHAARVVVFVGSGDAFSAGDDMRGYVKTHPARRTQAVGHGHDVPIGTYGGLRSVSQAVQRAVRSLDKLSIAAINGIAIQSGFSLALACDFRIAARTARMGSATLRFGLLPDEGGHYLLVQHLGVARALDFVMRKRIVLAPEAQALGLVHEVVERNALEDRALELARELASGPQVAMRMLKRSIYNAAELSMEQALDDIAARTAVTDYHPDAREGVAAWRQKRAPHFNRWLESDADTAQDPDRSTSGSHEEEA